MKRVIWLLVLLCGACGHNGGDNPIVARQDSAVRWRHGQTIVALGTSLTYGFGADCKVFPFNRNCALPDSSYPALLSARLKLPVVNLGVPGATTRDGVLRMREALGHDPALALVELGANDLFQAVSVADARANLVAIIEHFHREGVAVVLLNFSHPDMIDNTPPDHRLQNQVAEALVYHRMLGALAVEFGLPIVDYIFEDIWWREELMFDSVHPNGRGYVQMEENIAGGLNDFLAASELLL